MYCQTKPPSDLATSARGASSELVLFGAPIIPYLPPFLPFYLPSFLGRSLFLRSVNNFLACNNPASYSIIADGGGGDRVVTCVRKNANVVTLFSTVAFLAHGITGLSKTEEGEGEEVAKLQSCAAILKLLKDLENLNATNLGGELFEEKNVRSSSAPTHPPGSPPVGLRSSFSLA